MDDFNGHMCEYIDGFDSLDRGYGVDERNLDGGMLLKVGT